MSWSSGSKLAEKVWDLFTPYLLEYQRKDTAKNLADLFLHYDCDTIYECDFYQKYVEDYSSLVEENIEEDNKAILLMSNEDEWEGLYINGKLVKEGHTLNEGENRIKYFTKLSKQYNFDLDNMKQLYLEEDDDAYTMETGCFPVNIEEFLSDYINISEE